MPFQLRSTGRANAAVAACSADLFGRNRAMIAVTTAYAARPAPSSHLMAMPNPGSGRALQ